MKRGQCVPPAPGNLQTWEISAEPFWQSPIVCDLPVSSRNLCVALVHLVAETRGLFDQA